MGDFTCTGILGSIDPSPIHSSDRLLGGESGDGNRYLVVSLCAASCCFLQEPSPCALVQSQQQVPRSARLSGSGTGSDPASGQQESWGEEEEEEESNW